MFQFLILAVQILVKIVENVKFYILNMRLTKVPRQEISEMTCMIAPVPDFLKEATAKYQ